MNFKRRLRRFVQISAYLLFLFLLIKTAYPLHLKIPVNLLPRLSPLSAIVTMVASREFISLFLPSLAVICSTLLLGRFFCGWLCPLGTTLDVTDQLFHRKVERKSPPKFQTICLKYYLLIFLLAAALLGLQIAGWLDPLSLITLIYTVTLLPYLNFIGEAIFTALYKITWIQPLSEPVYAFLKSNLLTTASVKTPIFSSHILLAIIFLTIISLGYFRRRYWCRNLCPLGALLALLSRRALLRRKVGKACSKCHKCEEICRMGAITDSGRGNLAGECIECLSCAQICPQKTISFRPSRTAKKRLVQPQSLTRTSILSLEGEGQGEVASCSRRGFLTAILGSVVALPLLRLNYQARGGNPYLIRPPGSLPEDEFITRCIRCGECMKVCLTNGLQPTLLEAGLERIWTPKLVPRIGYCEYNCTLCTRVCSSGAIRKLSEKEKVKTVIGIAYIDKDLCIPYVENKNCLVCEEVCPTPTKAIKFSKVKVETASGTEEVLHPYILKKECVGCGICENKCPLEGKSAILVKAVSNQRLV